MPSAHEIALELLHAFGANVVARRRPSTYGQYASSIGRAPEKYGLAIGKAMHGIGALCVVRQLPVAPLYWVQRADKERRAVFESDPLESQYIIESGDIDVMYVVAREYLYSEDEFLGLENALRKSLENGRLSAWSPHALWHLTFVKKPKGSELTYYQRAMAHYRELFEKIKTEKSARR